MIEKDQKLEGNRRGEGKKQLERSNSWESAEEEKRFGEYDLTRQRLRQGNPSLNC